MRASWSGGTRVASGKLLVAGRMTSMRRCDSCYSPAPSLFFPLSPFEISHG